MTGPVVGSVAVEVVPSAKDFARRLRAEILPQAFKFGDDFGDAAGHRIVSKLQSAITEGVGKGKLTVRTQGTATGHDYGDAFGKAVKARMEAAFRSLPKAKLDANANPAEEKLAKLRASLTDLHSHVSVDLSDDIVMVRLEAMRGQLEALTGPEHTIRMRMDAGKALAELVALQAELDAVQNAHLPKDDPLKKISDSADKASGRTHLLRDAIVLIGPALAPIAGVATAALLGFGAAAGVAYLAVKGIQTEIKTASAVGVQYAAQLSTLKGSLTQLEKVAAKGLLPGFTTGVTALNKALPTASREVGALASQIGSIGGHALVGVVNLFQTMEPLLIHLGNYVDGLAGRFEGWAKGPGGTSFAHGLGQAFDAAIPLLENLAKGVVTLVQAFMPIGTQVLGVMGTLSRILDALPVPVVQALATAFVALYAANRLKGIFDGLSVALTGFAAKAAVAESRFGGLAASTATFASKAGGYATAIAAVVIVAKKLNDWGADIAANHPGNFWAGLLDSNRMMHQTKSLKDYDAALGEFTNTLQRSGGVTDDAAKSSVGYTVSQNGLAEKAGRAGISVDQLTAGITGNIDAYKELVANWKASGDPSGKTVTQLNEMYSAYHDAQIAAEEYTAKQKALAASQPDVWNAAKTTSASIAVVAEKYGYTSAQVVKFAGVLGISQDDIKSGALNNKKLADTVEGVGQALTMASATTSEYAGALQTFAGSAGTAADRAALIEATLKAANGDAISYATAMSAVSSANQNLIDTFSKATDAGEVLRLQLEKTSAKALTSAQSQNSFEQSLLGLFTGGQQALASAAGSSNAAQRSLAAAQDAVAKAATGNSLQQAAAQRQLAAAQDAVTKASNTMTQANSKASTTITGGSEAAIRNRGDLLNLVQAAQTAAEQYGSMGHSAAETRDRLITLRQAILDQATAHHANTAEVAAYLDTVLKIPVSLQQATINLKTGMINFKDAGAQPLAQALGQLQDAALKAAGATYQHELATKGALQASDDAYRQYYSQTHDQLVNEASQLGLTAAQAQVLADEYFGIKDSGDIKKQIELIGAGPLKGVLDDILTVLKTIASLQIRPTISVEVDQTSVGDAWRILNGFATRKQVPIGPLVPVGTLPDGTPAGATGGIFVGRGTGTSDSMLARVSNGEFLVNARATKAYRGVLENINKSVPAFASGGYFNTETTTLPRKAYDDYSPRPVAPAMPTPGMGQGRSVTVQQTINNPLPERASTSGPVGIRRAAYALGHD